MKAILRGCLAFLVLVLICSAYRAAASEPAEFMVRCAACHGATGAGDTKVGQNLHVRDLGSSDVQKQSDEQLATVIAKGKNKMPAFEGKLSRDQINELVKYIRILKK